MFYILYVTNKKRLLMQALRFIIRFSKSQVSYLRADHKLFFSSGVLFILLSDSIHPYTADDYTLYQAYPGQRSEQGKRSEGRAAAERRRRAEG